MRRALSLSVFYLLPMVFDSILVFYSCFYNEAWFRGVLGNKKIGLLLQSDFCGGQYWT